MAKTETAKPRAEVLPKGAASIVYTPLDSGDPHMTSTHGYKFHANVPRVVSNPDVVKLLRGNPHYSVDGVSAKRVAPTMDPVPPPGSDYVDREGHDMVDAETAADDRKMIAARDDMVELDEIEAD